MPPRWDSDGSNDIVLYVLRLLVDRVPRIQSNAVIEVEMAARRHWGGRRPYIRKRSPTGVFDAPSRRFGCP